MASGSRGSDMCDQLREKGNALYWQLTGTYVYAPPLRRMKFTQAEQYYRQALGHSRSPAERAACVKNLGMLCVQWSKFEVEDAVKEDLGNDLPELAYAKKKVILGVEYLVDALHEGRSADKSQEWLEHLQGHLMNFVEWAAEQSSALRMPSAPLLRCLCEGFDLALGKKGVNCKAAIVAHLRLADTLFGQGILKLGDDESSEPRNFKECISFMHDFLQILRKAHSLGTAINDKDTANDLLEEIKDLQERAQMQIFICESMQARQRGDEELEKAVNYDEEINVELAFQAVDFYRKAALLLRERDIEGEAIAMSKLGHVFSEVIKDPVRASKAHYQATKLALTDMSQRISRSNWYKYSSAKHAEHQDEVRRNEERQHEEQRAPTKKKLQEEIRKLDQEAKKGGRKFLEYIYQNHPNPDPKKMPGDMLKELGLTKEMLRKAITHYHPDANVKHGEEGQVLCEEISKVLNNKYEYFKLERQPTS